MATKSSSNNSSVSILGLMGLMFIGLKLTGYISWSWWWVTAPFWGVLALILLTIAIALMVTLAKR